MPNGNEILTYATKAIGSLTGVGLWELASSALKVNFAPPQVDEKGNPAPNWKGVAIKDLTKLALSGLTWYGANYFSRRGTFGTYQPEIAQLLDGMAAGGAGTILLDIVNESYNVTVGSDANAIEAWVRAQMEKKE